MRYPAKRFWIWLSAGLLLAALLWWVSGGPIYELNDETARFITRQNIPQGMLTLRAEECGNCHAEIYREWQGSLHAKAYLDPFFQAYFRKDEYHPSCLVCHTPLQNQLEQLVSYSGEDYSRPVYMPNPEFDPRLRDEGVTCAACHLRDGVIYGPYPAGDLNSPHPVAYDPKFTSKSICLTCHQVPARPFSLMAEGICSTGSEADEGPWAEQGAICQDCHMDKIERPLVAQGVSCAGRRHTWPGGYSDPQLRKVFEFSAQRQGNGRIKVYYRNQGPATKHLPVTRTVLFTCVLVGARSLEKSASWQRWSFAGGYSGIRS